MNSHFDIIFLLLGVVKFLIFVHFVMSWLIVFDLGIVRKQMFWRIWSSISELLEPIYGPIRRIMPQTGNLDLTPLVALLGIHIVEIILRNNVGVFF